MICIQEFRILMFVVAVVALPGSLRAEEKEKVDGCLTSLYNYPASVDSKREFRPLVSVQTKGSKLSLPKKNFPRPKMGPVLQDEDISNPQN